MFKYTAHPSVLHKYNSIEQNSKEPWNDHYRYAVDIVGSAAAYFACGNFWGHYKACEFYSKERESTVPINGILVSAEWFNETQVL